MTEERREHRYTIWFDNETPIEVRCIPADLTATVKPLRPEDVKIVTIIDRTACEDWVWMKA